MHRCPWAEQPDIMTQYHDIEWGVPVMADNALFELLTLESAQAGLSWLTVLKKRDAYRRAFAEFVPEIVATWGLAEQDALLLDAGIVRHRQKIAAAVNNARCFLEVCAEHGTFAHYIWAFVDGRPVQNAFRTMAEVPASTPLAQTVAKDLKRRKFAFLGPTTVYAFMQAAGLVNDHLVDCHRYAYVRSLAEAM